MNFVVIVKYQQDGNQVTKRYDVAANTAEQAIDDVTYILPEDWDIIQVSARQRVRPDAQATVCVQS